MPKGKIFKTLVWFLACLLGLFVAVILFWVGLDLPCALGGHQVLLVTEPVPTLVCLGKPCGGGVGGWSVSCSPAAVLGEGRVCVAGGESIRGRWALCWVTEPQEAGRGSPQFPVRSVLAALRSQGVRVHVVRATERKVLGRMVLALRLEVELPGGARGQAEVAWLPWEGGFLEVWAVDEKGKVGVAELPVSWTMNTVSRLAKLLEEVL